MLRALTVAWVMVLDGWPSSMWRLLIFLLGRVVADTALSSLVLQRKSTPATQLSQVFIQQSRMILSVGVLTTMLFCWSLAILFSCESSQVSENLPWGKTSQAIEYGAVQSHQLDILLTHSLPFFVVSIILELPWIDSLMSTTSYRPVSLLAIWHDAPESLIQVFFMNKKRVTIYGAHHTNLQGLFYIFCKPNSSLHFLFYFPLLMNTTPCHPHPHQWLFLISQIFYDCHTSTPDSPYSYALSVHNGSTPHWIFCFCFHIFLFSYNFLLFHLYFQGIFCLQVCGHTYQTFCTIAYTAYYMHPNLFLFLLFPLFILNFFIPMIHFFANHLDH